jgi:hypothetical protein
MTLCKGEESLRQQLPFDHVYYNFCLPHASLHWPCPQPLATNGTGSVKKWRPCTPAMLNFPSPLLGERANGTTAVRVHKGHDERPSTKL